MSILKENVKVQIYCTLWENEKEQEFVKFLDNEWLPYIKEIGSLNCGYSKVKPDVYEIHYEQNDEIVLKQITNLPLYASKAERILAKANDFGYFDWSLPN